MYSVKDIRKYVTQLLLIGIMVLNMFHFHIIPPDLEDNILVPDPIELIDVEKNTLRNLRCSISSYDILETSYCPISNLDCHLTSAYRIITDDHSWQSTQVFIPQACTSALLRSIISSRNYPDEKHFSSIA